MRRENVKTLFPAVVLFAINALLVRELFTSEFIAQMGSIEGAYIGLARYILANWPDLSWFPMWYGGIPFQNAYPPLFPFLVAGIAKATGTSPALAYHAVTAGFYCLGPVTLFWLAWRFSGSRRYAFASGLLYSLFSPSTLLIGAIRQDAGGVFQPRRLQALIHYAEVPHLAALTLVPVAIIAFDLALRKRRAVYFLSAALAMAAVVLTNWLGAFALAAAAIAYLLSCPPLWRWKTWWTAACISLFAYVLAMPWIPPSTVATIRANSEHGGAFPVSIRNVIWLGLLLGTAALAGLWLERRKAPLVVRFAALFCMLTGTLLLAAYRLSVFVVPQPQRYHFEFEMGLVLAGVFAARLVLNRLSHSAGVVIASVFLLFCAWQATTYRAAARKMTRPIDIRATSEYRAARWLDAHSPTRRVFAPGSISQWLLVFGDTPQLDGVFDQGITNRNIPGLTYQLYTGAGAGTREDEIGELWLKAYGIHAVLVGPGADRWFRNARKFAGRFKELWRNGDDVIYEVPQRSESLAHALTPRDLAAREPVNGIDIDPLRPYVAALDNPALPPADFRWINRHRATVNAALQRNEILSIQIAYHPGWRVTVRGEPRPAYRDRLGLLAVDPKCDGPCTVELTYDGGLEMHLARLLSWTALAAGICWVLGSAVIPYWAAGSRPT